MSADLEQDAGAETAKAPESSGQRLLAVVLTMGLLVSALVTYVFTPAWITRYRVDAPYFESPGFMPRVALAIVCICAVIHAVRVMRGASLDTGEDTDDDTANRRLVAIGVLLFVAYILAVPYVGYALASFVFVLAAGLLAGLGRNKSIVLAISIAITLSAAFVLGLKVWFPEAALFTRLF